MINHYEVQVFFQDIKHHLPENILYHFPDDSFSQNLN